MFQHILTLAFVLAPAAEAACLDGRSILAGVAFTRADGHSGIAVQPMDSPTVEIDYAVNTGTAWQDIRRADRGIYEFAWTWTPTDDLYVGGGPGGYFEYRRSGKEPAPRPDTTWSTTLRTTETQDYGLESGPETTLSRRQVTYSFLTAQEVKLSGCMYTAIPVEMRGSDAKLIHRWMYFPDLGFGLETRMTDPETGQDRKLGLTSMKAAR